MILAAIALDSCLERVRRGFDSSLEFERVWRGKSLEFASSSCENKRGKGAFFCLYTDAPKPTGNPVGFDLEICAEPSNDVVSVARVF